MVTKSAGEIMIPLDEYPHIPYWFTLRQAIAEMEKSVLNVNGTKSLPRALLVFDQKYHLLGAVRRRDILGGLEPRFLRARPVKDKRQLFDVEIDPNLVNISYGRDVESIRSQAEQPVSEVMLPIGATVNFEDQLTKVIYIMISKDLNLIPVVKGKKVVGVVRSVDVFREVSKLVL